MTTVNRQICTSLAAAFGLILVLASCAPKDPAPLRIGINAWPGYEFIYLAQVQGYYKDVGIAVDIVEFNSLSQFEGPLSGVG